MAIDERTTPSGRFEQANLFELSARRVRVSFSTTSFTGVPQLQFQDRQTRRLFRGDEIRIEDTALGSLVTVTLESIPDLRTVTFTLVLPPVNVVPGSTGARLQAPGLFTTTHTTIAGPGPGPEKTYQTLDFEGTAQFVQF